MQVIIINDSHDETVAARQKIRATHLFKNPVTFIGVSHELEASGSIIDTLDALDGTPGVILVNIAPRHGPAKKWENGTPFGYIRYNNALVVSTVDGLTLSLIKKFGLAQEIRVLDTKSAAQEMARHAFIPQEFVDRITKSQFRSFDFLPRIAAYLLKTKNEIGEPTSLTSFPDTPQAVWSIDNFGNSKTTILPHEIQFAPGRTVKTAMGTFICYMQLREVPDAQLGLIIGSSGLNDKRFLEIVIQGGSAAKKLELSVGDKIL